MALCAWTGVRLGEHSCNVAGLLLGLFNKELYIMARRLEVEPRYMLIAAGAAALLHDAGKAAKKFQETVHQCRPSFTCHELVAGKLVHNATIVLLTGLRAEKKELLATIAGIAALRHHHAMRMLSDCIAMAKRREVPGINTQEILELVAELEETCPEASTLASVLQSLARNYVSLDPLESVSAIENTISNLQKLGIVNKELLSLASSALTGLLSLADYLAATTLDNRSQDPKPRGYTKQVLKELKYLVATPHGTSQQTPIQLKSIAAKGRKILRQVLLED